MGYLGSPGNRRDLNEEPNVEGLAVGANDVTDSNRTGIYLNNIS